MNFVSLKIENMTMIFLLCKIFISHFLLRLGCGALPSEVPRALLTDIVLDLRRSRARPMTPAKFLVEFDEDLCVLLELLGPLAGGVPAS